MTKSLLLLPVLLGLAAPAAAVQQRVPELRREYADVLRYHLGSSAGKDVDRLAALHAVIWRSEAATDERRVAVEEYVSVLWPLFKLDESYRMNRDAQSVATSLNGLIDTYGDATEPDLGWYRRARGESDWKLDVVEAGSGVVPVLLIGGVGVEASELYAEFLEQNRTRYRMFAVSFPGLVGAERQPYPERHDYAARPWLSGFENAIATYLESENLDDVVVVGTGAGGYVAARLALDHPDRLKAAVLVGALLHTNARSPTDPDRPLSLEERMEDANRVLPTELTWLPRPPSDPQEIAAILRDPARSHPGLFNLFTGSIFDTARATEWSARLLSTTGALATAYDYYYELYTTDLTPEFGQLTVPTLAMVPGYAGTSPSTRAMALSQWKEVGLRHPAIPLQVRVFEDQPAYIATESPGLFSDVLADFLAGRPVGGNTTPVAAVLSAPRAGVTQTTDSLEVSVRYRRPSVGDQVLWGNAVPFGRVWNPGTAETTTIAFSKDAIVGGAPIGGGTYALLMIPTEQDWTVIFNRIPDQWQTTTYNSEFDALRLTVSPGQAPHQEQLTFAFEESASEGLELVWSWGDKRIELPISPASGDERG